MEDIAPTLFEEIERVFNRKLEKDAYIISYLEKLKNGKVDFTDTQLYAKQLGLLLSNTFVEVLKEEVLPDGRLYWNIAERVIAPMLKNNHKLVCTASMATQKIIDLKEDIGLHPLKPKLSNERIKGILDNVTVEGLEFEEVKKRMSAPIVNITESFFDDFIKVNADFRFKAGLKPQIIRILKGRKPCKWCVSLAGVYDYGELGMRNDIFKRHENCHCQVIYKTIKYEQDVWSKKTLDYNDDYSQFYKSTNIHKNIYKYSSRADKNVYKAVHYDNIYIANNVKIKPKQLHNINARFNNSLRILKTNDRTDIPNVFIINQRDMHTNAIGAYNVINNHLYLIPELGNNKEYVKNMQNGVSVNDNELSTFIHELLHWKKSREYIDKHGIIKENNFDIYKSNLNKRALDKLRKKDYDLNKLSNYAKVCLSKHDFDEVITEIEVVDVLKGEK